MDSTALTSISIHIHSVCPGQNWAEHIVSRSFMSEAHLSDLTVIEGIPRGRIHPCDLQYRKGYRAGWNASST